MKRFVSSLCIVAILTMAIFGGGIFAQAGTYEEECDLVFLKALERMLDEEGIIVENTEILKDPIYDIALNQLGFIYTMNILENEGYAIIINTEGTFDVTELFLNSDNPYGSYEGEKIYVSAFMYLVYQGEQFIETSSGLTLNDEMKANLIEKAFYTSTSSITTRQETITYTNRTTNSYILATKYPTYFSTNYSNTCTPTAGANIIGFYTRYFPELIPGFTPGNYYLGLYYMYFETSNEVQPVIDKLYNYMGTNTTGLGTTIAEFKKGLTKYVNEKGRNIAYTSNMQAGNFNYSLAKQRLTEDKPMVLFVDTFTVATVSQDSGIDYLDYIIANACHAMAGFGYSDITYTLSNGQTRTDSYIMVSTGLTNKLKGYYNINYATLIDEALTINIY